MTATEAQKRASIKYAQKVYKRVPLDLNKDYYESKLKPAAAAAGMSVNAFIKDAIEKSIKEMGVK